MRVLVVEDDADLNRQLATALKEAGYAVDTATDGEEGHFLGDTEPYDAVVLDIGLPVMDGYELAQRLLNLSHFKDRLRLIAVTGYGQTADRRRSEEAGFSAHLVKPIALEQLTEALREVRGVTRQGG